MSTRMNVIVKDKYTGKSDWSKPLWFYRHSDGYPDGALPTLRQFMQLIKDGKIRNNIGQASGWLIMLGAEEYSVPMPKDGIKDWKVGAIEPSQGRHGDIEYLYVLDLSQLTITIYETAFDDNAAEISPKDKKLAVLTADDNWQYEEN